MGIIMAVCTSEKKGTQKTAVPQIHLIEEFGIEGDAHAGKWHRQVSLLSYETIEAFKNRGAAIDEGAFGENVIVSGIDLIHLPVGTRLSCGDILLEVTQIGKECHSHCEIYKKMGECIMPTNGIFTRVIRGGVMKAGDEIHEFGGPSHEVQGKCGKYRAGIITLSDKGAAGEREDKSGPVIQKILEDNGWEVAAYTLLPDGVELLKKELLRLCDEVHCDLVLTTGGTGFSPRDLTPEATLAVAERNAPGIAEAIRAHSMTITKRAMLSRGVSVIRGSTLVINLPGSPKAVVESMDCIMDTLPHALETLNGRGGECGKPPENNIKKGVPENMPIPPAVERGGGILGSGFR